MVNEGWKPAAGATRKPAFGAIALSRGGPTMDRDRQYYELRKDLAEQLYGMVKDRDQRINDLTSRISKLEWMINREVILWKQAYAMAFGGTVAWLIIHSWRDVVSWVLVALLFLKDLI
jgi:hypothetical protein